MRNAWHFYHVLILVIKVVWKHRIALLTT
ncbi:TPA: DUF3265 domain-containing protein [Vibrio parahaemolyticus]|nr:DUF3265 domain-containing protein [Vibrio parahaemolyticus]HAV1364094.1 DUF3265 domain-containing protein [Vibrio parahaemolyticus]HAV1369241.1 DUF3265 domain-containing protein [Vibrio parahaemolyticus]HAV1426756.1 DUF3265 domain-containing protein [Vibrio parahaemolyticus]HAV1471875.1 DUF3265 domain-containing protein [Vibrio parahaemolyticus]